jgi:hypothetical protein
MRFPPSLHPPLEPSSISQGSSIGAYSATWLSQFYAACKGVSPISYFRSKGKEVPPANVVPPQKAPVKLPIKIVFPTEQELLGSWKGADVRHSPPLP